MPRPSLRILLVYLVGLALAFPLAVDARWDLRVTFAVVTALYWAAWLYAETRPEEEKRPKGRT